jgi:hypothetical protein
MWVVDKNPDRCFWQDATVNKKRPWEGLTDFSLEMTCLNKIGGKNRGWMCLTLDRSSEENNFS